MKPDPIGEPRNPLAVYLLVLALVSGLGLLVGAPTAGSIEAELPRYASLAWGAILAWGAASVLAGMYWQGDQRTGLLLKRSGFLSLSVASIVYSMTLTLAFGAGAFLLAMILLGFSWACGLQYRRVSQVIHRIIRETRP